MTVPFAPIQYNLDRHHAVIHVVGAHLPPELQARARLGDPTLVATQIHQGRPSHGGEQVAVCDLVGQYMHATGYTQFQLRRLHAQPLWTPTRVVPLLPTRWPLPWINPVFVEWVP